MMPKKKKTVQQKVDLTDRLAQGGAQRRESAQSESSFGTDRLFDDDPQGAATPNPERRRPTVKGMKHKVAKTLGLSKGSSSSTTPSDDTSGAKGSNSGTELIPSISLSPVMTHKANPRSPTSSDRLSTDVSVTSSPPLPSPLDDDSTVSSPGLDQEDKTVGSQEFTTTKEERASRMERAAQRSRASGSVDRGKQLSHTNKLKEQVKDLKEKLKAKNEELRTKLDQTDIEYQDIEQQFKTAKKTCDAQLEAHKEEIKQKDIEITKAAVQVKSLQEQNDKAKREEPPQQQIDDITQQLTEHWKAITQSHNDEYEQKIQQLKETHSDEIMKLTREHQEEIKKARSDCQDQLEKSIREELEKEIRDEYEQRRDEDIQKATTEESERWQAFNQQLKDKHEQKLNQIQGDHIKALAERTQKHKEDVAALREQARTLELKYLKKGDYVGELTEHGSPSTSPEQGRHAQKMDQPHQVIADIDLEKDHLKTELAAQQQVVRDLQHELNHQKEQYGQLEIQTLAKQQLSLSLSPTDSEGDIEQPKAEAISNKLAIEDKGVYRQIMEEKTHQLATMHQELTLWKASNYQSNIRSQKQHIHQLEDGDDNKTDAQKLEAFQQETQLLRTKLQELQATNDQLTQAIKIALSEQSVSETGVMESAETAKKLVHMKTMYLQQLNKAMEAREALEASKEEIKKLTLKLDTSKKSLTEKIKDKDHELQQLRRCSAISVEHPPTLSVGEDDLPDDTDPMVYISKLKAALQSKKEQVESLHCQVNSFEQIATQRQQLQSNSKIQSMVVMKLKKRLETVETELELARKNAERMANTNAELVGLQQEKEDIEDDKHCLEMEMCAGRERLQGLKAQQYEEDFKQERRDCENAFNIKDDNIGKFQVQLQMLRDELKGSQEIARNERREKQEVLANLEVAIKEGQQKQSQLAQAHNNFELFLQLKDKEIKQLVEEKQKLSIQYENQLKQVRIQNMQLQTKLKKKIDQLQATLQELTEQTETVTAEKLSLENQLNETTRECKLKIPANEKAAMTDDIAQAKATSGRMGVELQATRERLEIAIADIASLHDEVMAKTAQVKQYKKQTDSFKAKVEEANTKLLKTQRELQRCQELIITMEEDNQYQIEQVKASAESDKLAAVSDLIQTRKHYILMVEDKTRELETLQRDWEQFNDKQTQRIYELERTLQDLSARQQSSDELVPYCLPHLPALGEQQGSGSYGSVYPIQLNGISCIAKRIHDILLGQGKEKGVNIEDKQAAYQKFYSECVLLSRMRHPNIVQFMGVYYGPQRDYGRELTLVMERLYMNLGNCLEQYQNIVTWLKVSILLDVSQGLLHLHSQGIVHRDLTAANILLTTSFHAKIADLGVSKIINVHPLAASKQSMIPGTLGYMPPEALAEIPEYGYALDIFSFGVLILFVLLQEYPQYYENVVTVTGVHRKEIQIQKRMKWIAKLSPEDPMRQLICQCLQDEPERRPTTTELNSNLIPFARHFPKPYVDIIDMQRNLVSSVA